jgi:hypothetical protein
METLGSQSELIGEQLLKLGEPSAELLEVCPAVLFGNHSFATELKCKDIETASGAFGHPNYIHSR